LLLLATFQNASAECIFGASNLTNVYILDSNRLILYGGFGDPIYIKTFYPLTKGARVAVLKDSFCDYDSEAISINGTVIPVQVVKKLD
jgi:hypothetical protein